MVNSGLVSQTNATTDRCASNSAEQQRLVAPSSRSETGASVKQKTTNDCMSSVRDSFRKRGFSEQTTKVLMSSWKPGTRKQYQVYIRKWFQYCNEKQINKVQITLEDVLEYFSTLYQNGLQYSGLNTARGALSSLGITLDGISVGKHPMVIRYMRGIYNLCPPKPRYDRTWDVNKVLNFLRTLSPVKSISLKLLSMKLTMLIALTNAARSQTIHLMDMNFVDKVMGDYVFLLNEHVKQSRPGYKEPNVYIKAFPPDRRICVLTVFKEYISRTKCFRKKHGKLLLSYKKPHEPVSRDTIARWIKTVMKYSGIDTNIFKAHSVRSAAVSKAKSNSVPISTILKTAGWSNVKTFAKFYDKEVGEVSTFDKKILQD